MQHVLKEIEFVQISTSDPDCRQMFTSNNITEVAYNLQAMVVSKHNTPY
jgi:hypothetical protein